MFVGDFIFEGGIGRTDKDNIMFVGDFIFEGGIGRTDLEYGNNEEMKDSIDKILKYKEDIIIYPGHGNKTSLDRERDNLNFYKITL
jgi:glyoxylase-like metal-dependent hydrolase (beta-lactamase superfamily II)